MDSPGFFRYLAIIIYDSLLLLAVLFLATALALPFNQGEAFASNQYFFPVYLLTISYIFYAWFWTHGGQTLGMKAWKTKLMTIDQQKITWQLALKRFLIALFSLGLGVLWKLFDNKNLCLHDHLSKTRLFFEE